MSVGRLLRRPRFLVAISLLTISTTFFQLRPSFVRQSTSSPTHCAFLDGNLVDAVAQRADTDRWIILAVIDKPYADMALNLHETSFQPFDIDNFLFVGFDVEVCRLMCARSVPCFTLNNAAINSSKSSSYFSPDFRLKSHKRNNVILDAIYANFVVLYTDVDVIFLSNPLPELKRITASVDIAPQWDVTEHNSGFVVVNPTQGSRRLYEKMNKMASQHPDKTSEQKIMNRAIKTLNSSLLSLLPPRYPCGKDYFEKPERMFASSTDRRCEGADCPVVVHNNWIVSKAAKVYRFREHLMWMYDEHGEYYGNASQIYLTYFNPTEQCSAHSNTSLVAEIEIAALQTAMIIGKLLGRVVILPRFHCATDCSECSLNSILHVETFENVFAGEFRESSFLQHPKVPQSVKDSVSQPIVLDSTHTAESLKLKYDSRQEHVLVFASLHDVSISEIILTEGFLLSNYRQY